MNLDIKFHAQRRMRERRITEEDVYAVLASPDLSYPTDIDSIVYRKDVNGRCVNVATVPPGVDAAVVQVKSVWVSS